MNEPIEVKTTSLFWDCECTENYIHPKDKAVCERCHSKQQDSPDARVSELAPLVGLLSEAIDIIRNHGADQDADYLEKQLNKIAKDLIK
jgi:hypothetical protein